MTLSLSRKPEWYFLPVWTLMTALCLPVAIGFSLLAILAIKAQTGPIIYVNGVRHITEDYLLTYVFFPLAGLVTGAVQFGLLRRYLPRMGWWVLATALGWMLGFAAERTSSSWAASGSWVASLASANWPIDPAFLVVGLVTGLGQWLLLRRRLPRAGWWIAANIVAWGSVYLLTGGSLEQVGLWLLFIVPAAITGETLVLLMKQDTSTNEIVGS